MRSSFEILLLPGDGIGPEVVGAAREVVDVAAEHFGLEVALRGAKDRGRSDTGRRRARLGRDPGGSHAPQTLSCSAPWDTLTSTTLPCAQRLGCSS